MDFALTEAQEELQGLARRILGDRMNLEHLAALDASSDWFDRDTWGELARANLLGTALPEAHGGLGLGFLDLCLFLREVGRTVAPLPAVPCLASAALALAEFGTPAQQEVLGRVVAGDAILTAALTEFGAPANRPVTTARAAGGGWRIDGVKTCVPAVHVAEAMLVPATVDGAGDGTVAVFLVPTAAGGLRAARQQTTSREPQFECTFDGVAVDGGALLGTVERGREILDWIVARTTVALCAVASGVSEEAMRLTARYASERRQFDRPIATFQAVGQRLANCYIDNSAIELTMLAAATHLDEGREVPLEVSTAKAWAAEGGSRVVHAALHVHGGISIDLDFPIHRYFLWMKQIEFALGSGTPHLRAIGAALAEQPA